MQSHNCNNKCFILLGLFVSRVISTISKVLIQFCSTSTSFLFTIMIKCLLWKVPPGFPFVLECGCFWCDLISIRNCDASVTSILHWYCPYSLFWCIHSQCLGFPGILISIPVISSFSNDPHLCPQPHVASLTHVEYQPVLMWLWGCESHLHPEKKLL